VIRSLVLCVLCVVACSAGAGRESGNSSLSIGETTGRCTARALGSSFFAGD